MKQYGIKTLGLALALGLTLIAGQSIAAPSSGPKPKCELGKIAVVENGFWQCKQPDLKAESKPQQMLPDAGPRPNCKLGKIPVLKSGFWQCLQPDIKAREARGEL